jgi:hypothetical protein
MIFLSINLTKKNFFLKKIVKIKDVKSNNYSINMSGGIWHDIDVKIVLVLLTNIKSLKKNKIQSQTSMLIEISKNDKSTQYLACLLV